MRFSTWRPAYDAILDDFGYDAGGDEAARDELAAIVRPFDHSRLDFTGETVAVAGGAPTLDDELDAVREADSVVAASVAADACLDAGLSVDVMVTDLDKNPETARRLTDEGVPVAAHAHGDNREAVRAVVPTFDLAHTLGTTQAEPRGPVENFGGFTDGDRGAFLADQFGAERLVFPGWDFDDLTVDPAKARKLAWAERLLRWLEHRRGERFAVLDGRRDGIVLPWLDG
ncbi:DUF115 domain-containing protein [Salinirubellus salinus]|uniref:6-hydroxymethyl-7,8-dihydropterin pyrophosphokinase n=1 Tax=Salinirubellus salinus TaxID=1364945 RepID=A0A9E7R626_9EURY|nr:6-hydroxymethylpterin diphosphokinase MptE-like protein [Salinirubellus salinus]UWM55993.1 DUF115 domain-containing protein [Salinirubellus salinus]